MKRHHTRTHQVVHAIKASADAKRTWSEKFADRITKSVGGVRFLFLNFFLFLIWIGLNIDLIPGIAPFDPFPFGLLTMLVSLEAILLSIFVLISQNRTEKIDELRDEIDLQIDVAAEQELTKMLHLQTLILKKFDIDVSKDRELQKMLSPTNTKQIREDIEKQI